MYVQLPPLDNSYLAIIEGSKCGGLERHGESNGKQRISETSDGNSRTKVSLMPDLNQSSLLSST